jgi:hypothetical protein
MSTHFADTSEEIDRSTCRSICDAVGERLQRDLQPESSTPSPHIERLMDELRKRDRQTR